MPGTFGTLGGIPLALLLASLTPPFYIGAVVLLILFASVVAELHERYSQKHDPGEIVIDEVVGYVIAATWLPVGWKSLVAAFIVFRFFDILKPPPIRQIDQRVKGGLGTVLDDVAAGLAANAVLQVVAMNTDWLGVKVVL